jgi:hypothetical protein
MTTSKTLMSACILGLLFASSASALTLFSPPLVPEGNNVLDCYLVNVSNQARDVRIEIFSREGIAIETVRTTLQPGEEDVARAGADQLPRYCKFVVNGKKTDFRASVLVRQDGVGAISALPAE